MTQAQAMQQNNQSQGGQVTVPVKKFPNGESLSLPAYATQQSAGMDLLAAIDEAVEIAPSERMLIPTGIGIALPAGYEAQVRPRSGLAAKYGVTVLNTPGTIDADYRGELKAILINHGQEPFTIERGMRIAQMVIAKYEHIAFQQVDDLEATERGAGGFGSTGQ